MSVNNRYTELKPNPANLSWGQVRTFSSHISIMAMDKRYSELTLGGAAGPGAKRSSTNASTLRGPRSALITVLALVHCSAGGRLGAERNVVALVHFLSAGGRLGAARGCTGLHGASLWPQWGFLRGFSGAWGHRAVKSDT